MPYNARGARRNVKEMRMTRFCTVATPRWLLVGLGPLMLVLMPSTDAFPACPSVFHLDLFQNVITAAVAGG